jgi:Zn-dependent protease/CBS domain-containing protein
MAPDETKLAHSVDRLPSEQRSKSGFGVGSLFGFRITLDVSLVLVFALVLFNLGAGVLPTWHPDWDPRLRWVVALCAAVLFFGSILIHELAHALVGRALGVPIKGITLFMFGGMAQMEREPTRASAELWMAIAGPLTSIALGVAATLLGGWWGARGMTSLADDPVTTMRAMGPLATLLLWLGPINVLLAVFNMLPGFPLDGGRVLRAALWWTTGDLLKATRWATWAGLALSWAMVTAGIFIAFGIHVPFFGRGLGQGLWLVLIGWFLGNAARASYAQVLTRHALEQIPVADLMWTQPEVVGPNDTVQSLVRQKVLRTDQQVFPVVLDDDLVGAVSFDDLRQLPDTTWESTPVHAIMTPRSQLRLVSPTTDANDALQLLSQETAKEVPVVEGNRLIGLVRHRDLLRWLAIHGAPAHAG